MNPALQFNECSHGVFTITPAQGPFVANGVIDVSIDFSVSGSDVNAVAAAAEKAAQAALGKLPSESFDHGELHLVDDTRSVARRF